MNRQEYTEQEYEEALAAAKTRYCDWWNASWIPHSQLACLVGLSVFFSKDKDSGGLMPYDQGGFVPSWETWLEIAAAVELFYIHCDSAKIDASNWHALALKCLPRKPKPKQAKSQAGYVYLLKGGDHYKIGLSKDANRRMEEISPKMPFETELICTVSTEDMYALEAALHELYADKRANGEWFELDEADVALFKGFADDWKRRHGGLADE